MSGPEHPSAELRPGDTRAGCRVERLLGRGGMGAAYLATRVHDGAPVVLKLLAPGLARDPTLRGRFRREWEALRRLQGHPHVVGVLAIDDDDPPCIVLEFVDGTALDRAVARGPLPSDQALGLAAGVARGLAALHAVGIVHRDIKPANLIATPRGGVKVVDLGLAKDMFRTALTQPGQLLGTAHYMAPEQWEDGPIDARTDVYALGATLYHLLTGRPPFHDAGDDIDEVADRALAGSFPPPRALAPATPPEAELVVLRMLAPRAADRYAGAEDCAADLEAVRRGGAARVPCLVLEPGGARAPLVGADLLTLGADPRAWPGAPGPGLAAKHAQVRREERGLVVRDLQSPAGTFVGDQRLAPGQAHVLRPGDRLRLGGVVARFEDPAADGGGAAAWLRDVERATAPLPVVEVLAALGDARAAAFALERLAPDRWGEAPLAQALGPDAARAVAAWRRERAGRRGRRRGAPRGDRRAGAAPPRGVPRLVARGARHGARPARATRPGRRPVPRARGRRRRAGPRPARRRARRARPALPGAAARADRAAAGGHAPAPPPALAGRARGRGAAAAPRAGRAARPAGRAPRPPGRARAGARRRGRAPRRRARLRRARGAAPPGRGARARGPPGPRARAAAGAEAAGRALFLAAPAAAQAFAARLAAAWQERARAARASLAALAGHDAGPDPAAWTTLLAPRLAQVPAVSPYGWSSPGP
ncbi:MAG: FHA domain-containing serine/threonine-protein kinase [Planctomycetes bacterium]|nr:FHA domain-containing serine/threonine-protein kinase [Planctomycetota bacterium]